MSWRCGVSTGIAQLVCNFGPRRSWVVNLKPRSHYPQKITPGTDLIGDQVGPRAGLNVLEKTKILFSLWSYIHYFNAGVFFTLARKPQWTKTTTVDQDNHSGPRQPQWTKTTTVDQDLLTVEDSRSHSNKPHLLGFLCAIDQPDS